MREKASYAEKLVEIFSAADSSGDGSVTWEEFESLLQDWLHLCGVAQSHICKRGYVPTYVQYGASRRRAHWQGRGRRSREGARPKHMAVCAGIQVEWVHAVGIPHCIQALVPTDLTLGRGDAQEIFLRTLFPIPKVHRARQEASAFARQTRVRVCSRMKRVMVAYDNKRYLSWRRLECFSCSDLYKISRTCRQEPN